MKPADIDLFFGRLAAANPEPKSELNHHDPNTLLVAVVLSAQATDVGVNKATEELFREVRTPEAMLALGEEGLRRHIRTIESGRASRRERVWQYVWISVGA